MRRVIIELDPTGTGIGVQGIPFEDEPTLEFTIGRLAKAIGNGGRPDILGDETGMFRGRVFYEAEPYYADRRDLMYLAGAAAAVMKLLEEGMAEPVVAQLLRHDDNPGEHLRQALAKANVKA